MHEVFFSLGLMFLASRGLSRRGKNNRMAMIDFGHDWQGREHFSFRALLFPHELVAFLGVYLAFS